MNVQGISSQSLHHVLEEFSNEMGKGRPDFRTLFDLMLTVNTLFHQEFASANRRDVLDLLDEIRLQVAAVVNAHNKLGRTVALVMSGTASAAAGGLGIAGVEVAQHLASAAKAPEIAASLFNDWKDAALEEQRALKQQLETKQNAITEDVRNQSQEVEKAIQSAEKAEQAFREAMNAFCQPVSVY